MIKILLISKVPNPRLIEIAIEANRSSENIAMDIWFTEGLTPHREKYWIPDQGYQFVHYRKKVDSHIVPIELGKLLSTKSFDVILSQLSLSPKHCRILAQGTKGKKIPVIHWSESPLPESIIIRRLKEIVYRYVAKIINLVAVYAIGNRSFEQYSRILRKPTHLVPYFQKLPDVSSSDDKTKLDSDTIIFIFSGQMIPRNNINSIVRAAEILDSKGYKGLYRVQLFGKGPLKSYLKDYIQNNPSTSIELSNFQPDNWDERFLPIKKADILLSPVLYAGWGLTIPEALAFGKPVISSYGAESAKYYIREGLNGFLSGTRPEEIAITMERFIVNPEIIRKMKDYCVESSAPGSAKVGVKMLANLLPINIEKSGK